MPKAKGPDYEKEFVKAIRANLKLVLDALDSKESGLAKRINTFASRFDFAVSEVEKKIRKDEMFRAFFAKDPGKQKIHENIAARFIERISGVKSFKQLSHDSLVVLGGMISSREEALRRGAASTPKTIDFSWEYKGKTIYASHKFTKESGGAQDNQYKDLQGFIREANESGLKNTFFLAIADGAYYRLNHRGSDKTKLEHLKGIANRRNVFALSSDDLETWLKKNCK